MNNEEAGTFHVMSEKGYAGRLVEVTPTVNLPHMLRQQNS